MNDILEQLADLHKQATEERSHYYVAKCVRDAVVTITALEKRIAELEAPPDASAGLIEAADFTDQLFSLSFRRCEIDACEIMELGEKLGLLEQVPYDPKIHDGEIDADEGDMIFVRSAKGKALRARAADRSGE